MWSPWKIFWHERIILICQTRRSCYIGERGEAWKSQRGTGVFLPSFWLYLIHTSCRSESSNISLVVLDNDMEFWGGTQLKFCILVLLLAFCPKITNRSLSSEKSIQMCQIQPSKEIENITLCPLCYICTKSQNMFLIICFTELSLCREKLELLLARAGWLATHCCQSVSTPADTVATECDWRDELTRLRVSFNYVYNLKYFLQIHLNTWMF